MPVLKLEQYQYDDSGVLLNGDLQEAITEVRNIVANPEMVTTSGVVTVEESIQGYGGSTPAVNSASAPIIDLDYLGHTKVAWLPGIAGNYISTLDKNEIDYDSSTFENNVGKWEGLNKNLLTANQSSLETDLSGYTQSSEFNVNANISRSTAQALVGVASLSMSAIAAGTMGQETSTNVPAIPGQVYTAAASFRAAATPRRVRLYIWYPVEGVQQFGPWYSDNTAGWTQAVCIAQAPANATVVRVGLQVETPVAGEVHYVDAVSFTETPNANLMPISDFEDALPAGLWSAAGGSSIVPSREQAYTGLSSLKITAPGAGVSSADSLILYSDFIKSPVGAVMTYSAYVFSAVATTARMNVQHDNAAGTATISYERGPIINVTANTWTRITCTATVPVGGGSDRVEPGIVLGASAIAYVDAVQVVKGSVALPYLPPSTTNLITNPSFEDGTTGGWSANQATITNSAAQSYIGLKSLSATATSTGLTGAFSSVSVIAGKVYTASVYVRTSIARTVRLRHEWDAGGAGVFTDALSSTTAWTRLTLTFTAVAGTNYITIYINGSSVNDILYIDAVQIEHGSVATPYVDGSLGAAGYAYNAVSGYSWDSSENISPNPGVEVDTANWGGNLVTLSRDTTQAFSGVAALKAVHNGTAGDTYVQHTGFNLVPNTTYTVSFYVRADVNADWVNSFVQENGGGFRDVGSSAGSGALVANTWKRFIVTFTTLSDWFGATRLIIRIPEIAGVKLNGTNGNFWIDAVQIEQRPFVTPINQTGAANASTSTRRTFWTLGDTSVDAISRTQNIGGRQGSWEAIVAAGAARYLTRVGYEDKSYGVQTGWIAVGASTNYVLSTMHQAETQAEFQVIDQAGNILASSSPGSTSYWSGNRWSLAFTTLAGTTSIRVRALVKTGGTGYFYIDAVQLEKGTVATTYVLPLRITGDIDLRAKVALEDWTPTSATMLLAKWGSDATKSYGLFVNTVGNIVLTTTVDGSTERVATSSVAAGITDKAPKWVRATRTASNGTVTFYLSDDSISWTQLGTTISTTAGDIYVATSLFEIGTYKNGTGLPLKGKVLNAQVRAGIDGPVVVEFKPEESAAPGTTFTDVSGRVWTINRSGDATAEIIDRNTWAFTGSEYLTMPDRVALDSANSSFAVVMSLATRAAGWGLVGKRAHTGNISGWLLGLESGSVDTFAVSDGTNTVAARVTSAIRDGVSRIFGGEVDRSTSQIRLWRNGSATTAALGSVGSLTTTQSLRIGRLDEASTFLEGTLGWLAFFRRVLTSTEHADLAAWDGKLATEPAWLRDAATLYVNADDAKTRSLYRTHNEVYNLADDFLGDTVYNDLNKLTTFYQVPQQGSVIAGWSPFIETTDDGFSKFLVETNWTRRYYCDEVNLLDNHYYTGSIEARNPNSVSITVIVDWCDGGSSSTVLSPGETKVISTLAYQRVYDATYRFFDVEVRTPGVVGVDYHIELREPYVNYGRAVNRVPNDFTYVWAGTAHQSSGRRQAPAVVGASPTTGGGATTVQYQVTRGTQKFVRYFVSKSSPKASYRVALIGSGFNTIVPGDDVSLVIKSRAGGGLTAAIVGNATIAEGSALNGMGANWGTLSLTDKWQEFFRETVATATPSAGAAIYIPLPLESVPDKNFWIDFDQILVARNVSKTDPLYGKYFDGDRADEGYAEYSWVGTAHNSQSIRVAKAATVAIADVHNVQGLDSAPFRTQTHDREGADGGYVDSEFESIRTVTIEGTLYTKDTPFETFVDSLKSNYAPTRTPKPLYFQTDNGARVVFGKAQGFRYNKDNLRRLGSANYQAQIICEDPRIYSDPETVITITRTAGSGTITLGGNRPSPAKLTIAGAITNPTISYGSTTMTFNIALTASDSLVIDLKYKTVVLNGTLNRRGTMTLTGKWFQLQPSANVVTFGGGASTTATLIVAARSAWR